VNDRCRLSACRAGAHDGCHRRDEQRDDDQQPASTWPAAVTRARGLDRSAGGAGRFRGRGRPLSDDWALRVGGPHVGDKGGMTTEASGRSVNDALPRRA
jgi:hypothetical protein